MPTLAFGQVVNPTTIYEDTDIALHNTDVYYYPFAPPGNSDTRVNLCSISTNLRDPDGVGSPSDDYFPIVWDARNNKFDSLEAWAPCWDPVRSRWDTLGGPTNGGANINPDTVVWMRLFTANDKPDGQHSNLIAGDDTGDRVIISKNEDVDFRATGRVILKSGFHARAGCFFHAYTAPKYDTTVFSDEFNDTAKFHSNWLVLNNMQAYDTWPVAVFDSNLALVPDSTAHDGWALRFDLKQDSAKCLDLRQYGCGVVTNGPDTLRFPYSGAMIMSEPFPFSGCTVPIAPAWQDAPYGKWEIRVKMPDIMQHTNTYGGGIGTDMNFGEIINDDTSQIHPGLSCHYIYGPFRGRFGRRIVDGVDTGVFYSSAAHFTNWNNPTDIIINGFPYQTIIDITAIDTFLVATATTNGMGGFPSSLIADSTDSVTFYYNRNTSNTSDSLAWSVDSTGRYFTGPYADSLGDTLYFNKGYQPTSIHFPTPIDSTFPCHWDHNTGKIYLAMTLDPSAPHNGVHGFSYTCNEGPHYPGPPIHINLSDYRYHTYSLEILPHEMRILVDGHVLRRNPDRLIPPGYQQSDYATKIPRGPMQIIPAEFGPGANDSAYYHYFNSILSTCQGCWPVNGVPSAHQMIDYVKVWDLPSDVIVPKFPH